MHENISKGELLAPFLSALTCPCHIFSQFVKDFEDLDTTWWNDRNVLMCDSVIFLKVASILLARGRNPALTFSSDKIFTSDRKHSERIGNAFSKHPKTSETDQNSQSYSQKTEGWPMNFRTQFSSYRI